MLYIFSKPLFGKVHTYRSGRGLVSETLDFQPQGPEPPTTGSQLLGPVNPHPVGHARSPEKIDLDLFTTCGGFQETCQGD